jgi:hypothetical protein
MTTEEGKGGGKSQQVALRVAVAVLYLERDQTMKTTDQGGYRRQPLFRSVFPAAADHLVGYRNDRLTSETKKCRAKSQYRSSPILTSRQSCSQRERTG